MPGGDQFNLSESAAKQLQYMVRNFAKDAPSAAGTRADSKRPANLKFPAKITGNDGSPGPYFYSWTEVYDAATGGGVPAWTVKPVIDGGRSGSTGENQATNNWEEPGVGFNAPVPTNAIVEMTLSFDQSDPDKKPVWTFHYCGALIAGEYCPTNDTVYVDYSGISYLSFHSNDFDAFPDTDARRLLVNWRGFEVIHPEYTTDADPVFTRVCKAKILEFSDDGSTTGIVGPTPTADVANPGDSNYKFGIYWGLQSKSITADESGSCIPCGDPATIQGAKIYGATYVDKCLFSTLVTDDTPQSGQASEIKIGSGLSLGFTGEGCQKTATISNKGIFAIDCGGSDLGWFPKIRGHKGVKTVDEGAGVLGVLLDVNPTVTMSVSCSEGSCGGSGTLTLSESDCTPTLTLDLTLSAPKGDKGDKGDTGDTGPAGMDAAPCIPCVDGTNGIDGTNGVDGAVGPCPTLSAGAGTVTLLDGATPALGISVGGSDCAYAISLDLTLPCPVINASGTVEITDDPTASVAITDTPSDSPCAIAMDFAFKLPACWPYTPGDPTQWATPSPTDICAALDRLAAAVAGLLGAPVP